MKSLFTAIAALVILTSVLLLQGGEKEMKDNGLTAEEKQVILNKGTERPFTGKYLHHKEAGTYVCKQCRAELYRSEHKFESHCGWPAFDDEIAGAVKHIPDADNIRTEIVCNNCSGHLGHIFSGEGFTEKNIRHCVNSISLSFVPGSKEAGVNIRKAYFAGGCFWGVEHWFGKSEGVVSARSGYMGGQTEEPTYKEVCSGNTGHAETVEVEYDTNKVSFEELAKLFFEIHDPTQGNRQGPDVGVQYRSAIFYTDQQQKQISEQLIEQLRKNGFDVKTQVKEAETFWAAEDYHQNYYQKKGGQPYCHTRTKRF